MDDYIFLSVAFEKGDKTYYYLTNDDTIKVGDFVLVPVGCDDHESNVKVEAIEHFCESDAPIPIERIKWIIKKCLPENEKAQSKETKSGKMSEAEIRRRLSMRAWEARMFEDD